MSETLKIENYNSLNIKEQAVLDADTLPPTTDLVFTNNRNVTSGDFILVGNKGDENSEMLTINTTTDSTQVQTGATTTKHYRFDPVYVLVGNKIKIYRADNVDGNQPADELFYELVAIDIDTDQLETVYTDGGGSSDHWYKFVYFNSTTEVASSLADSGAARGGGVGDYVSLDAIRGEAGLQNNRNLSDTLVNQYRQQAQANVNGQLSGMFTLPFTRPINPTIERVTMLYAAGYLQAGQLGQTFNMDAAGKQNAKVTEADEEIAKIKAGQLVLIGENGGSEPTTNTTGMGMRGWPNASTVAAGGGDFKFRASDSEGYNTRQF